MKTKSPVIIHATFAGDSKGTVYYLKVWSQKPERPFLQTDRMSWKEDRNEATKFNNPRDAFKFQAYVFLSTQAVSVTVQTAPDNT